MAHWINVQCLENNHPCCEKKWIHTSSSSVSSASKMAGWHIGSPRDKIWNNLKLSIGQVNFSLHLYSKGTVLLHSIKAFLLVKPIVIFRSGTDIFSYHSLQLCL